MIFVAKTAGFCFGVENALNFVENLLKKGFKVYTLGNIINNPFVVNSLKEKGVFVLKEVVKLKKNEVLVIRSHGVALKTYEKLKELNVFYKDATCPFVRRIQKKVLKESKLKKTVLIAGDENHPEVVGIKGFCCGSCYVFYSLKELKDLFLKNKNLKKENILVVAQTTFNHKTWQQCVSFLLGYCEKIEIFNSICSATKKRQQEAKVYSKKSDVAVVVGGKKSSNTKKLYEICKQNCKSFFVEDLAELKNLNFCFKGKKIFLTAGASTPKQQIETIYNNILDNFK